MNFAMKEHITMLKKQVITPEYITEVIIGLASTLKFPLY